MTVAENQETPARFGIRSIPALIFFKRGEVKQVIVGAQTKGHIEEELLKLL
jgi:thioredoxin 1